MSLAATHQTESDATLHEGEILDGRYRVDCLLGQGGMAEVWAGTNERTGKRVALKALLPSLMSTPGIESLMQREGLAASRIDHPNVVTVFDVIEHRGIACIVMELLTGEPLDSYFARHGRLPVRDACALLLPAMRGVVTAHLRGVIHRDLKPQNIFVCYGPDGRVVTTKVLDFGISLIVGRAREPLPGQTPDLPMGTPAYMAPEQVLGSAVVDERVDVYGFGVLFFEALTGQWPFPGDQIEEIYEGILYKPVPSLLETRPDLPAELAQIIETALAKDPDHRHGSLGMMVAAIENEVLAAMPALANDTESGRAFRLASGAPRAPEGSVPTRERSGGNGATQFMVAFPAAAKTAPQALSELTAVQTQRLRGWLLLRLLRGMRWTTQQLLRLWGIVRTHRGPAWASVVGLTLLMEGGIPVWQRLTARSDTTKASLPPVSTEPVAPVRASLEPLQVESLPPTIRPQEPATALPSPDPGLAPPHKPPTTAPSSPAAWSANRPAPRKSTRHGLRTPSLRPMDTRAAGGQGASLGAVGNQAAAADSTGPRAGRLSAEDF
jgi:eukaryotic-like serine/threonine-protein kinase